MEDAILETGNYRRIYFANWKYQVYVFGAHQKRRNLLKK